MTQKSAVVLILDVGYSEYLDPADGEKFLKTSRECASRVIQSKIFTQSKDEVGLILMGVNDDEYSEKIHVAVRLGPPSWHSVRQLKYDSTDFRKAYWIEAVIKALDMLRNKAGKFSERKIVIFSSNLRLGSLHNVADMERSIQDLVVDLILIHPKITDDPKLAALDDEIKDAMCVVEKVEGTNISIEEAAVQLLSFQKKKVKPRPWNVNLDIGSKIIIPVSGFKKMNESQALKWKNSLSSDAQSIIFPTRAPPTATPELAAENPPDSSISVTRAQVNVRADGTEVDRSEMIEGYHFGSDVVPFGDENNEQMKYDSGGKCLSVVKVTKKKFVPRHFWIERSCTCIVARDGDEDAAVAFSAVVQALDQMESVAIVRRLYYSKTKPHMGALFPVIKPTKEFLVFIELPFSNYMRKCLLPELKVDHLTAQQFGAIDQLIDGMDLSIPENDSNISDRQWSDLLVPHKIFDPYLQHVRACVASRILNPGAPLPEIDPKLYNMLTEPPPSIKEAVSDTLDEISRLFPNLGSENDSHKKGRGKRGVTYRDADASNDDVSDDVLPAKQIKGEISIKEEQVEEREIGLKSPVEDFMAAITLKDVPFSKVCQQMQFIITTLVLNSFGLLDFEKPKNCLKALRNAVLANDVDRSDSVTNFNSWMKDVYNVLQEKFKMGFWNLVMQENLGFVTSDECSESNLSVHEVNEILGCGDSIPATLSDEEEMDLSLDL